MEKHGYKGNRGKPGSTVSFFLLLFSIMASVLDQIKQYTTIVADSGDFESTLYMSALAEPLLMLTCICLLKLLLNTNPRMLRPTLP